MKKTLIAFCLSSCLLTANATEPNSFYIGVKSGGASVHHGVSQFKSQNSGNSDISRTSVTYGAFVGYQITPHFATELGYEHFGQLAVDKFGNNSNTHYFKHSSQGTQLAFKGYYPLTEKFNVFGKVGGAFVNNRYTLNENQSNGGTHTSNKFSPILGVGVDYTLLPELDFRVEYQWLSKAGKSNALEKLGKNSKYSPDIHAMTVGFVYKFGQTPKEANVEVTQQISKNFEFDADVLFDFAKSNLKSQVVETLDKVYADITALELSTTNLYVNGYSDRIGTEQFNLTLSQKRADNVANYMIAKGLDAQSVTAIGHGNKYPITGNQCDGIKNQQALISCLAPDRRVTLQVKGTK